MNLRSFQPQPPSLILKIPPSMPQSSESPPQSTHSGHTPPDFSGNISYRKLHESMTDAFVLVSMDGRIIETNRAYQQLTGYSAEELLSLTYVDLTPAKWHDFEAKIVAEQIIPRGDSVVYQKEYRCKNGMIIPVELRTFLLRDEQGQPSAMWAIVRDITHRLAQRQQLKAANEQLEQRVAERTRELRESEERFRQLADASFEAIGISHQGILLDCNHHYADLFGRDHDEIVGRPVLDFVAPNSRNLVKEHISADYEQPYELELRHRDGSVFPAEVRSRMVRSGGRKLRLTAIRDLRASRQLEAELEQQRQKLARAEKLNRLAEIGAGIAHQLSQPLCAVMNNVAAAKASISNSTNESSGTLDLILDLEKDAARMAQIADRLRLLAKPSDRPHQTSSLNQLLTAGLNLILRGHISSRTRIVTDLDPDLPEIPMDSIQISQVIENLIRNALEAVKSCEGDQPQIRIVTRQPSADMVEFSVADNGPGINPASLPKIFDLFFSDKQDGTGIGLAICRRIIEAHHGTIKAANNRDQPGATFRVTLPTNTPAP